MQNGESENSYVSIPKEVKKESKVKFGDIVEHKEEDKDSGSSNDEDELDAAGHRYSRTSTRRQTGAPLVKMPVEDDSEDEINQNSKSSVKADTLSNSVCDSNSLFKIFHKR